ncbi:MAG: permease [Actinomycetota bacterium]
MAVDHVHAEELVGPRPPGRAGRWSATLAIVAAMVVAGVLFARFAGGGSVARLNTFVLVFSSLLVQALPFVLIGAVVSAGIEVFVRPSFLARLAGLPARTQLPVAALSGLAFPLCECGSVPVARRLAAKGMSGGAAVAFMLAAPVINPIVLVSTAIAYRGRSILWLMVAGRFAVGVIAAVAVGWVVWTQGRTQLIRGGGHEAGPVGATRADEPRATTPNRTAEYLRHFSNDTMFMARYLIVGAAAAAALQSLVPQSVLRSVGGVPVVDVLAMMALAALLSLCSESDAFVAASFVQFGAAPQLAFLLVGPMFNVKLAALYAGTFSRRFLRTVAIVVLTVVFVAGLWIEVFVR